MQGRRVVPALVVLVLGSASCGLRPAGPLDVLDARQRSGLRRASVASPLTVAVVDGGLDRNHPALKGAVAASWSAPGLLQVPTAHATQLAGIVAGRPTDDYAGGLAPTAELLDARALDAHGQGQPEDVAAALRWARLKGADVVLASLSLEVDHPAVRAEVAALVTRGTPVVAASGSSFLDAPAYPASYPGVLSVAAHDRGGRRLQLAGWQHADVVAPGERVRAPSLAATYETVSGTSVAAAVAAGLLAACGYRRPWSLKELRRYTTDGTVIHGDRALPRVTCPERTDQEEA